MTQQQISEKLTRLHFVGLWPVSRLAKECGFSSETVKRAMAGRMTARTQTRLEMLFNQIPEQCERPASKHKPGHKKRFLIRYFNLRNWIQEIEEIEGKNKSFILKKRYDMRNTVTAGFVCAKLDFMLKWYLLRSFGSELQKKRVFMGDCFSAEKWAERISKTLPGYKKDLIARVMKRKGLN